jgi:tetratricopeptide (TPR) repeat protein
LYKRATETGSETDYALAAKQFYTVYVLSPTDTSYLDNAALVYNKAKDYEKSSEMYEELLKLNYTGIATTYTATDKEGQEVAYPDEKAMNVQVKLGLVTDPKVEVSESRRNIIFKYLAENYVALDELDKALEVIKKGREEYPDSYELLITQANIEYKKGNTKKFTELLEEAIKLNPTNANLYYNVGVMNLDQKNIDAAMANFKKAIELDPKFVAAYQNMGTAIIDKAIPIVEEMNKNLNDFNKYDELQAQQLEIYKEALPYYEKAYELDSSNIGIIQTLLGLYENLSLSEKAAEMHEIYQELKG